MPHMLESNASNDPLMSVAQRVLDTFVDAVAEDSEVGETADRLREAILVNGDLSDAALRKALFGGDES